MAFNRPKFRAQVKAHKTVIGNERWFRKGSPFLGNPYSKEKTVQRHHQMIGIPRRAENRETKAGNDVLASALQTLTDKLMESVSNYTSCVGRCTRADELISSSEAGCHDK